MTKSTTAQPAVSTPELTSAYAPVNGLEMYYEIHGTGQPLVLLHGAFSASFCPSLRRPGRSLGSSCRHMDTRPTSTAH